MSLPTPPSWLESLLRLSVRRSEFETISGDLLEEYRERQVSGVRATGADVWYARQVLGFVCRVAMPWGILLGGAIVARDALDWFLPPADFHARSAASTYFAMCLLLTAGFRASWRSGSWVAGTVAGGVTATIAALVSIAGAAGLLAVWHDPPTLAGIAGSGGLSEAFTLPVFAVAPGLLLGTIGGSAAAAGRSLHPV
jgi:hypothetical protein